MSVELEGRWFHSFVERPARGGGTVRIVEWQGQIGKEVAPGWYVVDTYEWLIGGLHATYLLPITRMEGWALYPDATTMREEYERLYEHRLARVDDDAVRT